MKVMWLNDALVLRGECTAETVALSVVFNALEPKEKDDWPTNTEESEAMATSLLAD
jgi:hypothetical protein